jgi:hypothetical protein
MNLFDFQLLSMHDQVKVLYDQGVYIGKRRNNNYTALLYQLEGFYVEIYYRQYRRHIDRIYCSASTSILDPYLEQIDVVHLVN